MPPSVSRRLLISPDFPLRSGQGPNWSSEKNHFFADGWPIRQFWRWFRVSLFFGHSWLPKRHTVRSHLRAVTNLVKLNLDRLLWQPWRRRHTFGLVCRPRQKWMLKLEFLAHFCICGRAFTHVSGELFKFKIRYFYKKIRLSEERSFSRFLSAYTWEELFEVIIWKPR